MNFRIPMPLRPLLIVSLLASPALAQAACPGPVTDAVAKAYPGGKTRSCRKEKENGQTQYEVKLTGSDGKALELDVSPEGKILLTEETVAVDTVPKAVQDGFHAKYAGKTFTRAEKQTTASGEVTWELAFSDGAKRHESTFKDDGSFVEEE